MREPCKKKFVYHILQEVSSTVISNKECKKAKGEYVGDPSGKCKIHKKGSYKDYIKDDMLCVKPGKTFKKSVQWLFVFWIVNIYRESLHICAPNTVSDTTPDNVPITAPYCGSETECDTSLNSSWNFEPDTPPDVSGHYKKMLPFFWLNISSNMKATQMVLILLERGDPPDCFEYRTAMFCNLGSLTNFQNFHFLVPPLRAGVG